MSTIVHVNPRDYMYSKVESALFKQFEEAVKEELGMDELTFILGSATVMQLQNIEEAIRMKSSAFGLASGSLF